MRALLLTALLAAAAFPASAQVASGYQPQDKDERGLWMQMAEVERETKASNFVIRDPALNAYVKGVLCRTVGPQCEDARIYILRTPYFNASMAPNGMMQVWSGLFLRVRDEAQLAAVLDHEFTHYRNQHSLRLFRDIKNKTSSFAFLGLPLAIVTGGIGYSLAQAAMVLSIYGFSREQERDADAGSIGMLANAGYDPMAASRIWQHIREEREATGSQRKRKPRGDDAIFGTHPTTLERMTTLEALAAQQKVSGTPELGRERYRTALTPFWAGFVDDQVKLNDFGGTELLLANLADSGWTPELLYARGELYRARGRPDDLIKAASFYADALKGDAPVEAHRGLGLALLRTGHPEEGKAALRAYLAVAPQAKDRPMMAMLAGVQ